jgi:hypothetical protein
VNSTRFSRSPTDSRSTLVAGPSVNIARLSLLSGGILREAMVRFYACDSYTTCSGFMTALLILRADALMRFVSL